MTHIYGSGCVLLLGHVSDPFFVTLFFPLQVKNLAKVSDKNYTIQLSEKILPFLTTTGLVTFFQELGQIHKQFLMGSQLQLLSQ